MRKWVVSGIIILLLPWLMSLVWMHKGGQAVGAVQETETGQAQGIQAGLEAENQAAGGLVSGSGNAAAADISGSAGSENLLN